MKRHQAGLAFVTLAIGLLVSAGGRGKAQSTSSGGTLKVMCHYKGAGTVDESHKIYIALWDTPSFVDGSGSKWPIGTKVISAKNDSVMFTDIKASPVYVSAMYDAKGDWDAQSAPPSGSSLGLYSKEPPKPTPIEVKSGETETIHLSFDDAQKMP